MSQESSKAEKKKRNRRSAEKMAELVLEAERVGASQVCRRENLAPAQLSRWKQKFMQSGTAVDFFRNGTTVLHNVECNVQDSAWWLKTGASCVKVRPEPRTEVYSTEKLWIRSVENHLDHVHIEKYGE